MSKIVIYSRNVAEEVVNHGNYNVITGKWSNKEVKLLVESVRPGVAPEDLVARKKKPEDPLTQLTGSRLWAREEETKSLIDILSGND